MNTPAISVSYTPQKSVTSNELGMRRMRERAYQKRGEQYLLIKSPPASGKSRALMFIALDKLEKQGLTQALIIVPEKAIGSSFGDEPLRDFGFWADWEVEPKWNLCNSPGTDGGKVKSVKAFLVWIATVCGKLKTDLYTPDAMPANLRAAHDRNDETLERIYLGRRFKNDTERLFTRYTEMPAED